MNEPFLKQTHFATCFPGFSFFLKSNQSLGMRPDFAGCGSEFLNKSTTLYSTLVYHGPVHNAYANAVGPTLITVQGCKDLCGTGVDYYSWKDASNTITTWVTLRLGLVSMRSLTR